MIKIFKKDNPDFRKHTKNAFSQIDFKFDEAYAENESGERYDNPDYSLEDAESKQAEIDIELENVKMLRRGLDDLIDSLIDADILTEAGLTPELKAYYKKKKELRLKIKKD